MSLKEFWKKMNWQKKIILIVLIVLILALVSFIIFPITCSGIDTFFRNEVEKANYCNTKEDCIEVHNILGCTTYVNKYGASKINLLDTLYIFKNGISNCDIPFLECSPCFGAECKNNKCQPICLLDICDNEVKFTIKDACIDRKVSDSAVKIVISNDGHRDIESLKISVFSAVDNAKTKEAFTSRIPALSIKSETVDAGIPEAKMIGAIPNIIIDGNPLMTCQLTNIPEFGDVTGDVLDSCP